MNYLHLMFIHRDTIIISQIDIHDNSRKILRIRNNNNSSNFTTAKWNVNNPKILFQLLTIFTASSPNPKLFM